MVKLERYYCWDCHTEFESSRKQPVCPNCSFTHVEMVDDVLDLMDLEDLQIIGVL